jgi:hypothetical protein
MCSASASASRAVPFALLDRQLRLAGFRPVPLAYLSDVHTLTESRYVVCELQGLDAHPYHRRPSWDFLGLGDVSLLARCPSCGHTEEA